MSTIQEEQDKLDKLYIKLKKHLIYSRYWLSILVKNYVTFEEDDIVYIKHLIYLINKTIKKYC